MGTACAVSFIYIAACVSPGKTTTTFFRFRHHVCPCVCPQDQKRREAEMRALGLPTNGTKEGKKKKKKDKPQAMSLDQFNQLPPERIAGSDDGKTTDYRESVTQRAMCISVLSSLGIVVGHQAEQQRDLSLIHFGLSHLQKGMPLFRKLCLSSEICASSESYACLQKVVPLFRKLCLSSESCASLQVVVPLFRNL